MKKAETICSFLILWKLHILWKKSFGHHVSSDIFLRGFVKYPPSPHLHIRHLKIFLKGFLEISWNIFLIIFSSGAWLSIPPSPHLHIRHLRIPDYKLPPRAHQWPTNLPTLPRGTHVKILQNPGKRFNKIKRMKVFSHHQHQPKIWFKHCRNCNCNYSFTL